MKRCVILIFAGVPAALLTVGCQTTYYAMCEKLGKEKRYLLKNQVEKTRTEQEEASEQFRDVLAQIKAMYGKIRTRFFESGSSKKLVLYCLRSIEVISF